MIEQTMPLGMDDFRKIREMIENGEKVKYYIDKTLFIQDFLRFRDEVTLITRPRRFGKTLNMTMLRDFLDCTADSKDIFDGLAIMDTRYAEKINSTPVIYLTLKDCTDDSVASMMKNIANKMLWEYNKYFKIFNQGNVDKKDLVYEEFYFIHSDFSQLKRKKMDDEILEVTKGLLKNSLSVLIKAIRTFYDIRPMVIIDEYDQPIITAHEHGYRKAMTDLFGSIYGRTFKGNPDVGQAVMTGIQRVAKESIFSRLNNLSVYTIVDDQYSEYFGLNEDEVKQILRDFKIKTPLETVRANYDGYMFGRDNHMYNPWSILSFVQKGKLESHWINTSTNLLIRELIWNADSEFIQSFDELLENGEVEVFANLSASFLELEEEATLWGLLINAGYLTVSEDIDTYAKVVRIPNHEVRTEFVSIVAKRTKAKATVLISMVNALMMANMDRFLKNYQKLVDWYTSFRHQEESSYQSFLLGLLVTATGMYEVTAEQEAGDGLPDIVMKSKYPDLRPHVIIELKTLKEGEKIEIKADKALKQIEDKRYDAKLIGDIIHVGLVHDGKKCELKFKKVYKR